MIAAAFLFGILILMALTARQEERNRVHRKFRANCPPPECGDEDIIIRGREFQLPESRMHEICQKNCSYYASLSEKLQRKFQKRLQRFIQCKTFIIQNCEGYEEMPVLVSASAVQLCFGLRNFKLPFYEYVQIMPSEYFSSSSIHNLTYVGGNVEHNTITIAWNHLLNGYVSGKDGTHVGLHEMAHALYNQKIVIEEGLAPLFSRRFNSLMEECRIASSMELAGSRNLFSPFADNNVQEIWAESVELFFEKPVYLKEHYPGIFNALVNLLQQNPLKRL